VTRQLFLMIIDDPRFLVIYDIRYGNNSLDDFTRVYSVIARDYCTQST